MSSGFSFLHDHRPARDLIALVRCDHRFRRYIGEVVRHDMPELGEPEERERRQHLAFARYRIRQDHVERAQTIGLHDQQLVFADCV